MNASHSPAKTAHYPPLLRQWRWRVFAATWLSYAGLYFCRKPFFITKSNLGTELHLDATALASIGTAYLVAYTVGQFVAGALGTRWGPRALLLTGMAVSIGANVAFGMINSFGLSIAFMVINGLAQATGWAGNVGTMANWFARHERGSVMGIWATNFQVGGVAANALAAWALGHFGHYRASYFCGSLVLLAVWAFFLFNQRNRPEDVGLDPIAEDNEQAEESASAGVGWSRTTLVNVLLIGVFYFFLKFIRYALWSWAPFLLQRNFGLQGSDAGYLSTIFDLAGVAGVIVLGWLSDKVFASERARVSFYSLLAMVAACVLLYTLGSISVPLFALSLGLVGFTLYGPDALMTGAGAIDAGNRRGAVLAAGIINGMGSIGTILQEVVIGKLYDSNSGNLAPILGLLLGAAAGSTIAMWVVLMRNRRSKAMA